MTPGAEWSRRCMLGGLASVPLAAGCAGGGLASRSGRPAITIYSPAPPAGLLHALNLQLAEAVAERVAVTMPAVALPASIDQISALPFARRAAHLPIVTTIDFHLARRGGGPDWHDYNRANADLKLVSALYEVGFGIATTDRAIATPEDLRGKRIAAPARPSAVRLLTELLLRDGWGVLDSVELVDTTPASATAALQSGAAQATSWNLVLPGASGFAPMLPLSTAYYLPIDDRTIKRINATNSLVLSRAAAGGKDRGLLSFMQGLAAWQHTDPFIIAALLQAIRARGRNLAGLPDTIGVMAAWPNLRGADVHPVALAFFARHGLAIAE